MDRIRRRTPSIALAVGLMLVMGACAGDGSTTGAAAADPTPAAGTGTPALLDALPAGEPTVDEAAGMLWMREEEKLARDVYLALYDVWGLRVFSNIASAEERHMASVATLLERYDMPDPASDNSAGVFTDPLIQSLYDELVIRGSESVVAALEVGAYIEELDIDDLRARATDISDIALVYANLEKGSRYHLRAFLRNLENRGVDYQPTVLALPDFDAIVSGDTERGASG